MIPPQFGKVFISIHVNSTPKASSARGFETYLLRPGKSNDAIEVAQRENAVIKLEKTNSSNVVLKSDNFNIA